MSVYLRAAKMLALGPTFVPSGIWCCCDVIRKAENEDYYTGPAVQAFEAIFRPEDAEFMWWPHPCHNTEQTQQQRLLALLFMHWMTK